jgi:long-chain acyl-CoA synthetase
VSSAQTLQALAAAALMRPATQPAIEFEGRWFTWGELRQLAERVGGLLEGAGAGPCPTVAFVSRNRPSAVAALLAALTRGCTVRMLYAFQSPTALAHELQRLKPLILVADAEDCSGMLQEALQAEGVAAIALQGMAAAALPGLERCRFGAPVAAEPRPQIEILTSGTTGPPKRFVLDYVLIARNVAAAALPADPAAAPPVLLFFPFANISGLYSLLPPLLKGQRAVLLERFSVGAWHQYLLRHRPEASGLPPAGVQMVLDADIPRADLACLRRLGTGAAPLDPAVQRAFEERYGVPILLSYGATEFGGPVTAMTLELHAQWGARKFGSAGRALPGAQLRVIDAETGALLPPGREGLLEVVSPRIGPHWIRTSDLALLDEDGFLFHRGRADGAIIRGGFKLLPETIERALRLHPAVSAAAVVGVADPRLGQVPVAAVEVRSGPSPTVAELETHLRERVLATHIPVAWRFVEALPRTPSFKVDQAAVRRLFASDSLS